MKRPWCAFGKVPKNGKANRNEWAIKTSENAVFGDHPPKGHVEGLPQGRPGLQERVALE
jgi:hypothetical protein